MVWKRGAESRKLFRLRRAILSTSWVGKPSKYPFLAILTGKKTECVDIDSPLAALSRISIDYCTNRSTTDALNDIKGLGSRS